MPTTLLLGDQPHALELRARHPALAIDIDGRLRAVDVAPREGERHVLVVDGVRMAFDIAIEDSVAHVRTAGHTLRVELVDPRDALRANGQRSSEIRAPMPGAVIAVHARPGDAVTRGQPILTIESMKLQMELSAPRDGSIAALRKAREETFDKDDVLVVLQPQDEN